jgi:mono/diheme cytochrome c family protein
VNDVRPIDLASFGLGDVRWLESVATAPAVQPLPSTPANPPSAVKGRHLYEEVGCAACHSLDGTQAGKLGPTFKGLFGSVRMLEGGGRNIADAAYIRRAVLQPGLEVTEGFDQEMPSFKGILGTEDVESIVLFIRSLSESYE